jgi:hypothetical protein
MSEWHLKRLGMVVTLAVHVVAIGGVWAMGHYDGQKVTARALLEEQAFTHIEAGLAIKSKSASGRKSRLPQKDLGAKARPQAGPSFASDPDSLPKDKKDELARPKDVDLQSLMNRNRNVDTTEGEAATESPGVDEESQVGQADGSEFGTLEEARGDPYVGELSGRMEKNLVIPVTVKDESLETLGCVRLDASGKIVERVVPPEYRSRNHAFNQAVEEALKHTTDMEAPVPAHLVKLLVENPICKRYRP